MLPDNTQPSRFAPASTCTHFADNSPHKFAVRRTIAVPETSARPFRAPAISAVMLCTTPDTLPYAPMERFLTPLIEVLPILPVTSKSVSSANDNSPFMTKSPPMTTGCGCSASVSCCLAAVLTSAGTLAHVRHGVGILRNLEFWLLLGDPFHLDAAGEVSTIFHHDARTHDVAVDHSRTS